MPRKDSAVAGGLPDAEPGLADPQRRAQHVDCTDADLGAGRRSGDVGQRHARAWLWRVQPVHRLGTRHRSEEHTSELPSLMRISYAAFCLEQKKNTKTHISKHKTTEKKVSRITQ